MPPEGIGVVGILAIVPISAGRTVAGDPEFCQHVGHRSPIDERTQMASRVDIKAVVVQCYRYGLRNHRRHRRNLDGQRLGGGVLRATGLGGPRRRDDRDRLGPVVDLRFGAAGVKVLGQADAFGSPDVFGTVVDVIEVV